MMAENLIEVGDLTTKLGAALQALAEAKQTRDTALAAAHDATQHYQQLFDLVKQLQKEIHQAIEVCLHVV